MLGCMVSEAMEWFQNSPLHVYGETRGLVRGAGVGLVAMGTLPGFPKTTNLYHHGVPFSLP